MGLEMPNKPKSPKKKLETVKCEGCGATHNEEKCPYCGNKI